MASNTLPWLWNELLPARIPDDPPPPPPPPPLPLLPELTEDFAFDASLSDHDLQEKIQRISRLITSGGPDRFSDKGFKLYATLRQLNNELDRRNLARIQKSVGEMKFEKLSDKFGSNTRRIEPNSQGKVEDKTGAAFGEELRLISHDTKRNKKSSLNNKSSDSGSSNMYSSHAGKTLSRRLSKRRRVSNQGTTNLDLEEVQHVVLLDDDVQPINSIQGGDTSDNWKEVKFYYPSRDDAECVELSYSDLKCLDPESYLSSPIMNFYIQHLLRSDAMVARKEEFYVFNTYFYSKLEEAMTCKDDRTSTFLKLRRWWKSVDIFRKAYILLPIHGDMHWSLVIICIPAKEDESSLIILHLDSLGVHASNQIFSVVSSYLKAEHDYINQNEPPSDPPVSERLWKYLPRRIEKEKITVPQQKNDYDCGLFVLFFMKQFIEQAPKRLKKKDFSMFGKKWFNPAEASGLRKTIREKVIEMFESKQLEKENTVQESHELSSMENAVQESHELSSMENAVQESHALSSMEIAVQESHALSSISENIEEQCSPK